MWGHMAATSIAYVNRTPALATNRVPHVLVVNADPAMWEYVRKLLADEYSVSVSPDGEDAVRQLASGVKPDIVLFNTHRFDSEGLMTLSEMRITAPWLRIILLSSSGDARDVVRAMKLGVRDVVQKPFGRSELRNALQASLGRGETPGADAAHEIPLDGDVSFVHCNQRMKEIRSQCSLVARVDLPVLILGESGTGKEILAHYIHKVSPRAHRTFLKVNCAAMPADLLESELFGYEQGAFTGATKAKPGKFEICNNGTILLDEIGEMPPSLQAKLLQVLQDGSFSRLGSRTTVKVDVRVIAATNIDIKAAIAQRKFREDLFYRLNGFTLNLPPLRERKEEIPILLKYFMRKIAEKYGRQPLDISPVLMQACCNHNWPGNLRELENFAKRFLVLADESVMLSELAPSVASYSESPMVVDSNGRGLKMLVRSLKDDAEAIAIARALDANGWNRKKAAVDLQISYKALLYKIKQYNLVAPVNA